MKLFMICQEDLANKPGVRKKVFGQANAFQTHGFEVMLVSIESQNIILNPIQSPQKPSIIGQARNIIEVSHIFFQKTLEVLQEYQADIVYIRAAFAEPGYLKFLRQAKALSISCYCEFATYPYDLEYRHKPLYKRLLLLVDKYYRRRLHKYIQHAFTYTNYSSAFGIPVTRIENGIDVASMPKRTEGDSSSRLFTLLGVANVSNWQGYDRVLTGLKKYYDSHDTTTSPVRFDIVGDGPALKDLHTLCERYNLQQYVTFWGTKGSKELQTFYQQADIGISTLAFHRKGLGEGASLKSREYCAVGLPFVYAFQDNDFPEHFPYALRVSGDDSPLDIEALLHFFKQINIKNCLDEMRQHADQYLDWKIKIQPVVRKIQSMAQGL